MFSLILKPYNTWYPGFPGFYKAKADGVTLIPARKGMTYSGKYNIFYITPWSVTFTFLIRLSFLYSWFSLC